VRSAAAEGGRTREKRGTGGREEEMASQWRAEEFETGIQKYKEICAPILFCAIHYFTLLINNIDLQKSWIFKCIFMIPYEPAHVASAMALAKIQSGGEPIPSEIKRRS
jgi:hypothetical protein